MKSCDMPPAVLRSAVFVLLCLGGWMIFGSLRWSGSASERPPVVTPPSPAGAAATTSPAGAAGRSAGSAPVAAWFRRPRLDAAQSARLAADPAQALDDGGWNRSKDDLLVAWAARDLTAALAWIDRPDRPVMRAHLLGALAAGVLVRDGEAAARAFLAAHDADPELREKDRGGLERFWWYHLGRGDTAPAALEMLQRNPQPELAASLIEGLDDVTSQASAMLDMQSRGVLPDPDYWSFQSVFSHQPEYWSDWALQHRGDLLPDVIEAWNRDAPDAVRAWINRNLPPGDLRDRVDARLAPPPGG